MSPGHNKKKLSGIKEKRERDLAIIRIGTDLV